MSKALKTFSDKWVECRVHADLSSLPAHLDIAIPLLKSLGFLAFALFWTIASLGLLADASRDGLGGTLFGLFFVMVGLFMLTHFSALVGARIKIQFEDDRVCVYEVSWFRPSRTWHLPYSDFEGVVMRQRQTTYRHHTTYFQIVELLHTDRRFIIPLYVHPEMGAPRKLLCHCAERFALPALQATSNTFKSIEPFTG